MSQITHFTDKQREVEKWINNLGFRTDLEVPFGQYCIDIHIPELNWAVEVDGPSHTFKKQDKKRDARLMAYGLEFVMRVPVSISEKEFCEFFTQMVIKLKGDDPFENRN
jgi:very-short-patch-repair endonuclease